MISTLMFDRTITVAPLGRAATVLAAKADEARVLVHATADEAIRYVYMVSLAGGKSLFILAGVLIILAIVIGFGLSRGSAGSVPKPPLVASSDADADLEAA
jgi:hypothetical protein